MRNSVTEYPLLRSTSASEFRFEQQSFLCLTKAGLPACLPVCRTVRRSEQIERRTGLMRSDRFPRLSGEVGPLATLSNSSFLQPVQSLRMNDCGQIISLAEYERKWDAQGRIWSYIHRRSFPRERESFSIVAGWPAGWLPFLLPERKQQVLKTKVRLVGSPSSTHNS